jgi:hypothetical protein
MYMNGLCPKCEGIITQVNLARVSVMAQGNTWVGVSYQCPSCNCVLSVGIDPVALKTDTVEEILKALKRR